MPKRHERSNLNLARRRHVGLANSLSHACHLNAPSTCVHTSVSQRNASPVSCLSPKCAIMHSVRCGFPRCARHCSMQPRNSSIRRANFQRVHSICCGFPGCARHHSMQPRNSSIQCANGQPVHSICCGFSRCARHYSMQPETLSYGVRTSSACVPFAVVSLGVPGTIPCSPETPPYSPCIPFAVVSLGVPGTVPCSPETLPYGVRTSLACVPFAVVFLGVQRTLPRLDLFCIYIYSL